MRISRASPWLVRMSRARATAFALAALLSVAGLTGGQRGIASQGTAPTSIYTAGRAAWDALRDGRHDDAAEAFAAALRAEPRDPSLHLGAGVAQYLLGRTSAAQQSLERALTLAPWLTTASLLLGDILTRAGDSAGALRVYEAALGHANAAPESTSRLRERIEALRREISVHSGFYESQGAHFAVLFEGPADEALARRAIDVLEAAYWRIGSALSTFPDRVVTVVLYTEEQFRDMTRSPQWASAAYDGRIRVPVGGVRADSGELERVLTHEFTHALVQAIAPRGVPTWLDEGLAVTFEPGGAAWADEHLAASSARLPLERLTRSFAGLPAAHATLAYAQSAAAVRALLDLGGAPAVVAVLQDLARGETFERALERHLFMEYETFIAGLQVAAQ